MNSTIKRTMSSGLAMLLAMLLSGCTAPRQIPLLPRVAGPWWTIARNPDLGPLNGPPAGQPNTRQEPVDFAVWQAADGTWQRYHIAALLPDIQGICIAPLAWVPDVIRPSPRR